MRHKSDSSTECEPQSARVASLVARLKPRHRKVGRLLAQAYRRAEVAKLLGLSENTIHSCLRKRDVRLARNPLPAGVAANRANAPGPIQRTPTGKR